VNELFTFFGLASTALLPLVNPLGSALVFLGLAGPAPPHVYRSLAKRIAVSMTLFLIVVEAIGTALLKFFGISLPVMQLSGGLVIASLGWNLLNETEPARRPGAAELDDAGYTALENKVFYPLTFPITAGPGCLVVMVTLSAHASAVKGLGPNLAAHAGILLALVLLAIAVYACYGYAPAITTRIRPQTAQGIVRVMSFILFCIGVQIAWNGAQVMLRSVIGG
jgi:multiple antibiotic resistance protein